MKRNADGTINFSADPEVKKILEHSPRSGRTAAQQRKLEKDQARNRIMLDLPPDLESRLKQLAAELSVPVSSLVAFLLSKELDQVEKADLEKFRVPTRSMRYEFLLPYAKNPPAKRGKGE